MRDTNPTISSTESEEGRIGICEGVLEISRDQ